MHTHSGRERKEWLTQGNMGVEDSERGRNAERTGEAQETGRAEEAEDGVVVVGGVRVTAVIKKKEARMKDVPVGPWGK